MHLPEKRSPVFSAPPESSRPLASQNGIRAINDPLTFCSASFRESEACVSCGRPGTPTDSTRTTATASPAEIPTATFCASSACRNPDTPPFSLRFLLPETSRLLSTAMTPLRISHNTIGATSLELFRRRRDQPRIQLWRSGDSHPFNLSSERLASPAIALASVNDALRDSGRSSRIPRFAANCLNAMSTS